MCAIHGILDKRTFRIEQMIEAAKHRGPDGQGKWFDDEVKRPFNINDDNLDIIIADVKALKELYNQQGGN